MIFWVGICASVPHHRSHSPVGPFVGQYEQNRHPFFRVVRGHHRRVREIGPPTLRRVARNKDDPDRPDNVIITLHRAKGPLVFDLGICLVLITLPTLALFVAIQMLTKRRPFLPPFSTWYAAMLFAVVPLRNALPGSPVFGSWIDLTIVLWVLVALVISMLLYIAAWARATSKKT